MATLVGTLAERSAQNSIAEGCIPAPLAAPYIISLNKQDSGLRQRIGRDIGPGPRQCEQPWPSTWSRPGPLRGSSNGPGRAARAADVRGLWAALPTSRHAQLSMLQNDWLRGMRRGTRSNDGAICQVHMYVHNELLLIRSAPEQSMDPDEPEST